MTSATASTKASEWTVAPEYRAEQEFDAYSTEEHATWAELWRRRMPELRKTAGRAWLQGAELIGLDAERIPDLYEVNRRLDGLTGWNAVPVSGFIPAADFFRALSARRFPTTVKVRAADSIDYTPEPDIFHDVFGHVPLHAETTFANFLQRFGHIASMAKTEEETTMMARLFWFTVEFGLIREDGETKIYGSGLISSAGDAKQALGAECDRRPFDLEAVLNQPFEIDHFQTILFVVESFEQLEEAVEAMERRLENRV
ncbi:MAG: phenylalanine 4-monooxygenase [Acidobacteria bacterium]|nr:phenylalanine 4-monooxygenase [Acidobacteriota bacterium]